MMMIAIFLVDNSVRLLEERRPRVRKLLVKCRLGCGKKMSKKTRSPGGAIYPQFVSWLRAACSPFEYLLEHVVIAVDVVVFLSQRRDSAARMEDGGMVAVAECIADIRQAHLSEVLRESHCELTGPGDVSTTLFRMHVGQIGRA